MNHGPIPNLCLTLASLMPAVARNSATRAKIINIARLSFLLWLFGTWVLRAGRCILSRDHMSPEASDPHFWQQPSPNNETRLPVYQIGMRLLACLPKYSCFDSNTASVILLPTIHRLIILFPEYYCDVACHEVQLTATCEVCEYLYT